MSDTKPILLPSFIGGGPEWSEELALPGPRKWLVEHLVPSDAITILFGDGGVGKSTLALSLAISVASGMPWLDFDTVAGTTLYLDWELDRDEYTRRVYAVARGLGMEMPPANLGYCHLRASLGRGDVRSELRRLVEYYNVKLVVIDSLTVGSFSVDTRESHTLLDVMKGLESMETTVLCIDHVAKPQPGFEMIEPRPFGSTFKHNIARSTLLIQHNERGSLLLKQRKSNFGTLYPPVPLTVEFTDEMVRYDRLAADDERTEGLRIPSAEKVLAVLIRNGHPMDTGALSDAAGIHPKTTGNALTQLKQQNRVKLDKGLWCVVEANDGSSSDSE